MVSLVPGTNADDDSLWAKLLLAQAAEHKCARHPFFLFLERQPLSPEQAAGLLRNYDAHATVLRRLLLKAAAAMPEEAVGFVLENVRNEYGNGDCGKRHQLQLRHLADCAGITSSQFMSVKIESGVREYIRAVTPLYCATNAPPGYYRPAITAGAITATEIMALKEFRAMQKPFAGYGLAQHVWFDHVNVEAEHAGGSLALALYFIENHDALEAVRYGLAETLAANCHLYDGFLSAMTGAGSGLASDNYSLPGSLHESLTKSR